MMTVYRAVSGRLHRSVHCTGGPGPRGVRRIRITEAQFDEAKRCKCLWVYRDDDNSDRRRK